MPTIKIHPEDKIAIAQLYVEGGASVQDIADEWDVTKDTIYRVLRETGAIEKGTHSNMLDDWDETKLEAFRHDYYNEMMPIRDLAKKYGLKTKQSVYFILDKLGLTPRTMKSEQLEGRKMAMDHAVKLYDTTNLPIRLIVEETGVHQPDLHRELHSRGITLRRNR